MSRGTALLIAGHYGSAAQRSVMRTAGHIGDVLLATGSRWEVRRAGTMPGDPGGRAELRRWQDHPSGPGDLVLVTAVGRVVATHAGPALVTSAEHAPSDDAPLALSEIRDSVREAGPGPAVIVLGGWSDAGSDPALGAAWLAALATERPGDLIAVGAAAAAPAIVAALLEALVGRATDPITGTVTLRSLGDYLVRSAPGAVILQSSASQTVVEPAPLAGAWDPRLTRRSQVATEPAPDRGAEPDDLTGVVLPGRFRVDAMMARGGFGAIYRARQLAIERDVAVKVLHTIVDPASPSGRLFVQEIQSVGRIDHPNVVKIYQADVTAGGRLFFAMELLAGRDLERVIQDDGVLAAPRAVALTCQLLAGLGAAHDMGLVHADVKPANALVVLGRDGERVVLVDFGLSRLRPVDQPARSLGGTPAYMAPEQLRNGRVDARSDLFSAALVLVTLLTGWRRRSIDALAPPLDDLPDGALRPVLLRALAIDPADRFQTATELADALAGRAHVDPGAPPLQPPFGPAAFTELDADRLQGRERELSELLAHVLYQRTVVLAGPAAIGKTSLLRAGLIPRLAAHGMKVMFHTGAAGAAQLRERISSARWDADRTVFVVDALDDVDAAAALLGMAAAIRGGSLVVCVRDDVHAALASRRPDVPAVKLGLLDREGARAALTGPLAERRLVLEPALLARLIARLESAGPAPPGINPAQLQRVGAALYEAWPAGESTLTLARYVLSGELPITELQVAPRVAVRRPRRARWPAALGLAAVGVAAAVGWRALGNVPAVATPRATVIIGGSGTVLFGFLRPIRGFIEDRSATSLPILSQYDLGSGGAMRSLQAGELDLAALSTRFDRPVPADLLAAGKLLVEVPVGYDETALFVRRDNPLRRIDVAAIRAHLCCDRGQDQPPTTWQDLGLSTPPFAGRPVGWTLFGRDRPPVPHDSTSATLLQADGWLCGPRQLCASSRAAASDVAANEILSRLATDADFLALSTRAFSTDQVVALETVDSALHTRLDGRKVLWLYFAVVPSAAVPARLCRLFDAILDPSLAGRLAQLGKAQGLPDDARQRQRRALGLDDGSCAWRPVGMRQGAGELDHGVMRSPIAATLEIRERWVADPAR